MAIESASWVTQLVDTNPVVGDPVGEGDDHLRMIKTVLQNSFPSTSTAAVIPNMSGNAGRVFITDGTDSAWSSVIYIDTLNSRVGVNNVAPTATLDVDGSAIFNESGAAVDFRIEGDTDSNLFFVDGSTDRIGIGTNTPSRKLDVNGDASINTLRIGLGSGNIASNSAVGYQSLNSNTTGFQNTAVGYQALSSNTIGDSNTAVGFNGLRDLVDGQLNVAVGHNAGSKITSGNYNIGIGALALFEVTTGTQNVAVGHNAGRNLTSGSNVLVGHIAGTSITTGNSNVGIGTYTFNGLTTGSNNTAIGHQSLAGGAGSNNTAVGRWSLLYTTGSANTAVGGNALQNNTTASNNTAVGNAALYSNTTGSENTAVGYQSLYSNTTGIYNTAFGYQALDSTAVGGSNTAIGRMALKNTTGTHNTAVGTNALYLTTAASSNTAVGSFALSNNTTGGSNIAVGHLAGYNQTTANNNISLGGSALYDCTTGGGNIAIGTITGDALTTGINNVFLGNYAARGTNGNSNVVIGTQAADVGSYGNIVAVGFQALRNNTASLNVAVGHSALYSNTTGTPNTAVGYLALYTNTTGYDNTAVGYQALKSNTTGFWNTAVGRDALLNLTTGSYNVAVGRYALDAATTNSGCVAVGEGALSTINFVTGFGGGGHTAVGRSSLRSLAQSFDPSCAFGSQALLNATTGEQNSAFGYLSQWNTTTGSFNSSYGNHSLRSNTTGSNNVAIGIDSMLLGTGNNNTAIGTSSLRNGTTPSYNTVVGSLAGTTITSGSNLTVIGYDAEPSSATATNEITLGDANVTDVRIPGVGFYIDNGNVGIGTASPNNKLEIKDGSPGAAIYPLRIKNDANTTGTGAGIEFLADGSYVGGQIYVNRDVSAGPRHSLRFSAFGSPSTGADALTILDNGNVGIGTTNPNQKLTIDGANQYVATQQTPYSWGGSSTIGLKMGTDAIAGALDFRRWIGSATTHGTALITQVYSDGGYGLDFRVDNKSTNTSATTSRMFLSISGEVGIGTTSPAKKLDVSGEIRASTGILFGTDTAAANTLDDYEEGTFTPGIEFGGGTTGITYLTQSGRYTKIGNMVYCDLFVGLSNKGTSTGQFFVTGLPYTVGNYLTNTAVEASCSISVFVSGNNANQVQGFAYENSTKLSLFDGQLGNTTYLDDTDFNNNTSFRISVAYAV